MSRPPGRQSPCRLPPRTLCAPFAPLSLTIPWALCPSPHPCFPPPNHPLRNGRTPGGEILYR
eukprot:5423516-Pyramimonas_sp.AAC.1